MLIEWIGGFLYQGVFALFAALLLLCSFTVVLSRQPVKGALALVAAFFCSAVLWLMLQAEFLALALIFVYVGAVMTLFLYVVMMLNVDYVGEQRLQLLPLATVIVVAVMAGILGALQGLDLPSMAGAFWHDESVNPVVGNTLAMGRVLYTDYVLAFEAAGLLLLVAMIAAITVAFRGRRQSTKAQKPSAQVGVEAKRRLRVVDLKRGET